MLQPWVKESLLGRALGPKDIDLLERLTLAEARENFYSYRRLITPNLKLGWWQREVAVALEQFYYDWIDGLCPILILMAPPQHGKSRQIIDFITWVTGRNPDTRTIYASYADSLGQFANSTVQRTLALPQYQRAFANTRLTDGNRSHGGSARNSEFIEFLDSQGSFRNTTVRGKITGHGLDLGIIDDPIKGREEAQSEPVREKTWLWLTDDFFTRFSEQAAMIFMMTRWHLDDPAGRLLARYPHARVLKYPALGHVNSNGVWVADEQGEPLFPELKSRKFLLRRRTILGASSWTSLYQQSPTIIGGDMFPVAEIKVIPIAPSSDQIKRSVRYWDKAGTAANKIKSKGAAATAGVLMHELTSGKFVVEDVVRGQWSALDREKRIKQTAELDNRERLVETYVEQEPGSGGKESAESTVRNLRGYRVYPDRVTSSKVIRAEPYAAQVQAGNVQIVAAEWNRPFLNEHELFPNGQKKDQVDSASGAFIKLTVRKRSYDTSMGWVTGASEDGDESNAE